MRDTMARYLGSRLAADSAVLGPAVSGGDWDLDSMEGVALLDAGVGCC